MDVRIADDAAGITRPGVLVAEGVQARAESGALDAALAEAEARIRAAGDARVDAAQAAVRAMYRRFGVDPTRTRPSSEALRRRLRKGERLPRVSTLVDIGNWCSAETALPYGLYDLDRIEGPVVIRLGRPGEHYPGIRRDDVHVAGRLVAADASGPFGNPTADSARTMVTASTSRLLVIVFAPAAIDEAETIRALELTAARLETFAGGRVVHRQVGVSPWPGVPPRDPRA
jgi:DNA/RNA-binding domain of Phe-tRNA-synthetase-like protein